MTEILANQLCTKDQAIKLKANGLLQTGLFYFDTELGGIYLHVNSPQVLSRDFFAITYTVAELGAMLLKDTRDCNYHNPSGMWTHNHTMWDKENAQDLFATQAECYADRLLYIMHTYAVKYTAEFMNARLQKFYALKRTQ